MNSKKLGLFAAAAVAVLAGQANANDAHKAKGKDAAAAEVCTNACSGKEGNEKGTCGGKVQYKTEKTKEACDAKGGKWVAKAEFEKTSKAK